MVTDLTRLAELLINRDHFANAGERYNIKILPSMSAFLKETGGAGDKAVDWLPFMNFTVFDNRTVMMGGFHNSPPDREPFIEIHNDIHLPIYYIQYWNRIAGVAEQFSLSNMPFDRVLEYARTIPGSANVREDELKSKVEEVKATMRPSPGVVPYIPRW